MWFLGVCIVLFIVLFIHVQKRDNKQSDNSSSTEIPKITPESYDAYRSIENKKEHSMISSTESSAQIHPSSLDGSYYRSYYYNDVKFYPPVEMVSKISKYLLRPGVEIILKPEPMNKYDNRAIALYICNNQIGYILRGTLQDMVHDYMDKNLPIKATLRSLMFVGGEYQGYFDISFYRKSDPKNKRLGYSDIDIHAIQPSNPNKHPNTPLTGKAIVFSGYYTIPIEKMMQFAVDAGATLKSRVTKNIQYLVVGEQDQSFLDENGLSSKERTARKLIDSGEANIKIINEYDFLRLASTNKTAPSPAGTEDQI